MKTCPNCATGWFSYYENGTWREGYCQYCSYEEKVPSNRITNLPVVATSPRPRPSAGDDRIKKYDNKTEKHWTKI